MDKIKKAAYSAVATVNEGADAGEFTALVAVFGNVDYQGDIIDPGAFLDSIAEWEAKALPIPVIWSHEWEDPFSHIGGVTKAQETAEGLQIDGVLDLSNPTAAQVYKLMKSGRVVQFSFVARASEGGWSLETTEDGDVVSHLTKLDLIEVGPTLRGANPETQLISIKSATEALDPRGLGTTNLDTIKSIHEHLGEVITLAEKHETSPSPKGREEADDAIVAAVPGASRAKAIANLIGGES